jgi:hypothetical protein
MPFGFRSDLFAIVLAIIVSTQPDLVAAETRSIELNFDFGASTSCEPEVPCIPWSRDLASFERELHPMVPQQVIRVVLQSNETLRDVIFEPTDPRRLRASLPLVPRFKPFSLPTDPRSDTEVAAYSGGIYPRNWIGDLTVQHYRGFKILSIPIFPLRVVDDQNLEYISQLKFEVKTRKTLAKSQMSRCQIRDIGAANISADLKLSTDSSCDDRPGYLIIGPEAIVKNLDSGEMAKFVAAKTAAGLDVFIDSLEQAAPSRSASDIRRAITNRYRNNGVDYVLLVGDGSLIPWKKLASGVGGSGDPIPSDQYYGCLDGDFSNPSSYDWACEVAVGRVPARSVEQFNGWVTKTLHFESVIQTSGIHRILNYGEQMDSYTLGGWSLDLLKSGSSRSLLTQGFPGHIEFFKLYDSFAFQQPAQKFIDSLRSDQHFIVNHLGHANQNYVFRMQDNMIPQLPQLPGFYYSQGCYPNDPDVNNWTQQAILRSDIGPAAMISNTRYGWYGPGQGNEGPSNVLHRAFWSTNFKDGIKEIGRMNHRAKELAVGAVATPLMRYAALESNLLGDPALDLGLKNQAP